MILSDYLDAATRRRWRWGAVDCTLFAGDWALALSGRDPGDGIRGTYETEAEALAIVDRAGGMMAFIGQRLEGIGWQRMSALANHPREGDIGVIEAPVVPFGAMMLIPAIHGGDVWDGRWIARGLRGLSAGRFAHRAFWRWSPC